MAQYIDKDTLLTEIERRQKEEVFYDEDGSFASWADQNHYFTLESIKNFIDTIEVKDVNLKEEIKNRIDNLSNLYCYMEDLFNGEDEEGVYPIPENVTNELFDFAKHFFELGMQVSNKM